MKKDLIFISIISVFLISFTDAMVRPSKVQMKKTEIVEEEVVETAKTQYGIPIDLFNIEKSRIKPNMSLSVLLAKFNIPNKEIHQIILKAKEVFDLRKIRVGNTYQVFKSKDSSKTVNYLVYEQNPSEYVVFDFSDSIKVKKERKLIKSKVKIGKGVIESSLWVTMLENDINPLLAIELSDIYAWTIDFFGIQKGDAFKVYYREDFVDSISLGIKQIYAAKFTHNGQDIYAIPFYQDSVLSFYDVDGKSLRKAFLKAPLKYNRIASRFSNSRLHPILKIRRPHHGVDYSAPIGTPVHAIGDGVVIKAQYSGGAGNYVKIRHNSIYTTGYMHLSKYGKGIKTGKFVKQGDIIGYVGSTGLSTGPHLDFRVWKNGININPLKLEAPPVEPIKPENFEFFNKIKDIWVEKLDNL
ncbi:MAG: peptidoglycan DD-metalloendopeptidase family protein [Bacteroidales bacterium]|nr:peptidoglycan DD-metalloendopeptidase family protein [Bacteroidales bacterium]